MQRPRATEGEEGEVARVGAEGEGDHADRTGHRGVGELHDRLRRFVGGEAQRFAKAFGEDLFDGLQGDAALDGKAPGVEPAEEEVGVGNRGFGPAPAIADGARVGAGALRADFEEAGGVDARDGAAAGADGAHVDHGHVDRHGVLDLDLVRDGRFGAAHQRHVGRGAAHVVGQQIGHPGDAAGIGGGHHARGGAGHDGLCRLARHETGGDHAAIAVHHQHVAVVPALGEAFGEAAEVAVEDGLDAGVDGGRDATLEFTGFLQDGVAEGDVAVGPDLGQHGAGALFMGGVGVGMEEVDNDGLAPGVEQGLRGGAHGVFVKRGDDGAGGIDPFRHFEAQVAGDEGRELAGHAVGLRPGAAAKFEHVAETLRGDEARAAELAFENGVCGGRGAVHDEVEGGEVAFGGGERVHHAEGLVFRRAGHLGDAHGAGRLVELQ